MGGKSLVKALLLICCSACGCRQATGGFKGSNREGLVFSLDTTKRILRQVLAAIQGVHRTHTLHGDIKPDNFLVSLESCECCTTATFAEYAWPIWMFQ